MGVRGSSPSAQVDLAAIAYKESRWRKVLVDIPVPEPGAPQRCGEVVREFMDELRAAGIGVLAWSGGVGPMRLADREDFIRSVQLHEVRLVVCGGTHIRARQQGGTGSIVSDQISIRNTAVTIAEGCTGHGQIGTRSAAAYEDLPPVSYTHLTLPTIYSV